MTNLILVGILLTSSAFAFIEREAIAQDLRSAQTTTRQKEEELELKILVDGDLIYSTLEMSIEVSENWIKLPSGNLDETKTSGIFEGIHHHTLGKSPISSGNVPCLLEGLGGKFEGKKIRIWDIVKCPDDSKLISLDSHYINLARSPLKLNISIMDRGFTRKLSFSQGSGSTYVFLKYPTEFNSLFMSFIRSVFLLPWNWTKDTSHYHIGFLLLLLICTLSYSSKHISPLPQQTIVLLSGQLIGLYFSSKTVNVKMIPTPQSEYSTFLLISVWLGALAYIPILPKKRNISEIKKALFLLFPLLTGFIWSRQYIHSIENSLTGYQSTIVAISACGSAMILTTIFLTTSVAGFHKLKSVYIAKDKTAFSIQLWIIILFLFISWSIEPR